MDNQDYFTEQQEEIEALKSIFESEFYELTSFPPSFMIALEDLELELSSKLQLRFTFPGNYPDELPIFDLPMRSEILPKCVVRELMDHLRQIATEFQGAVMVFSIVDAAKSWLNENAEMIQLKLSNKADNEIVKENPDKSLDTAKIKLIKEKALKMEVQKASGCWNYVIGLVGKPSAGKSTFFNAATQQNLAKVAQHPFTTIEPNIGKAFVAVPCPCADLQEFSEERCNAEFGHTASGKRFIPVVLKDVAGLIPGACDGRGMGNMFLNDLLDADVLIHIIDISGETDENGKQTVGYDPHQDVEWLECEIQRWIFDNIMKKWDSIVKRPTKLYDMFTGYHTSPSLIQLAFLNAGIDDKDLCQLSTWTEQKRDELLKGIVKEFLKVRFPVVLALNKCDRPESEKNIEKIGTKFEGIPMIPVSAFSECLLQQHKNDGTLLYEYGESWFDIVSKKDFNDEDKFKAIKSSVLDKFGSTGVLQVLDKAIGMRPPVMAYPVTCLDTYRSYGMKDKTVDKLCECILLKSGTSVNQLYEIMCHSPLNLVSGDYVRAECKDEKGTKKVLHKDDIVKDLCSSIVKIMTTKRGNNIAKGRS